MKIYVKTLLVVSLICLLGSCAAPKNVAYFQNAEDIRGMSLQKEQPVRLRPKDKINILVSSADPMLVSQFNLTAATSNMRSISLYWARLPLEVERVRKWQNIFVFV